jgi:hypothetical protein
LTPCTSIRTLDPWARPNGDIVPLQSTQFSDLKHAEVLRASLMAQVGTDSVTGAPLSECIEKYLATREQELDARTLNQHHLALESFRGFLRRRRWCTSAK